jgi:hypothetical protein
MIQVLKKPLVPLLLAGALAALAGCSGRHSEAATAPTANGPCTVGPTAGNNQGCDAYQDQGDARQRH